MSSGLFNVSRGLVLKPKVSKRVLNMHMMAVVLQTEAKAECPREHPHQPMSSRSHGNEGAALFLNCNVELVSPNDIVQT